MSHNGCWFTTALWVLVLDLIVFIIVEWGNGGPDELNLYLWERRNSQGSCVDNWSVGNFDGQKEACIFIGNKRVDVGACQPFFDFFILAK